MTSQLAVVLAINIFIERHFGIFGFAQDDRPSMCGSQSHAAMATAVKP